MTDELWKPVILLPNIELTKSIDGELAAFLSASDPRAMALSHQFPTFADFLSRFSNQFGGECRPTILAVSPDAPREFATIDNLASLRDVLAMSIIPLGRSRSINTPTFPRVVFSNSFDFYPWMIGNDFETLVASTPAIGSLHTVSAFHGQTAPEINAQKLGEADIDWQLFKALLIRWQDYCLSKHPEWRDLALIRSLNMAYHASRLPALSDTRYLDYGRICALWISAFEILAHPQNSKVNANVVKNELIRKIQMFSVGDNNSNDQPLLEWLYNRLDGTRNKFLHGNPVTESSILLKGTTRNIENFAAPLYYLALTTFLKLTFNVEDAAMSEYTCRRNIESAIAKSRPCTLS